MSVAYDRSAFLKDVPKEKAKEKKPPPEKKPDQTILNEHHAKTKLLARISQAKQERDAKFQEELVHRINTMVENFGGLRHFSWCDIELMTKATLDKLFDAVFPGNCRAFKAELMTNVNHKEQKLAVLLYFKLKADDYPMGASKEEKGEYELKFIRAYDKNCPVSTLSKAEVVTMHSLLVRLRELVKGPNSAREINQAILTEATTSAADPDGAMFLRSCEKGEVGVYTRGFRYVKQDTTNGHPPPEEEDEDEYEEEEEPEPEPEPKRVKRFRK